MPGSSGWKPWWYFSWPVAVSVANVRPWKEPVVDRISYRPPCSLPQRRASFIAASFASAPLLQRKTRSANECRQRSAASSTAGAV